MRSINDVFQREGSIRHPALPPVHACARDRMLPLHPGSAAQCARWRTSEALPSENVRHEAGARGAGGAGRGAHEHLACTWAANPVANAMANTATELSCRPKTGAEGPRAVIHRRSEPCRCTPRFPVCGVCFWVPAAPILHAASKKSCLGSNTVQYDIVSQARPK